MSDADVERKLAAILSADVVGYSRLMGDDEHATLATLTEYREVMREHITSRRGRVVDSPGDALLAEFPSAVQAVEAVGRQNFSDRGRCQSRECLAHLGGHSSDLLLVV
jgi:class 3 adenylate cyclase